MGIGIPRFFTTDEYIDYQARYKSLNDINYISERLKDIDMLMLYAVQKDVTTVYLLIHHLTKVQNCIHTGMLYEREKLIETYLKLDKRVRQLITVILHFSKYHRIKKVQVIL